MIQVINFENGSYMCFDSLEEATDNLLNVYNKDSLTELIKTEYILFIEGDLINIEIEHKFKLKRQEKNNEK